MSQPLKQFAMLERFACLGAECPDTCCHGWDMRVDNRQISLYKESAPALMDTVDRDHGIMKRDAATGYCEQFCEGLCRIHASYGARYLSDSCYFYPRMIHNIGGTHVMTAALSCPESLRLMLSEPTPFALQEVAVEDMPAQRSSLLPADISSDEGQRMMAECIALAGDATLSPELIIAILLHAATRLQTIPTSDWPAALPALLAERVALAGEPNLADPHRLYYALMLLMAFGMPTTRTRLGQTLAAMENALDCAFIPDTRELKTGPKAGAAYASLLQRWNLDARVALAPIMRRWIQGQLAMTAFPFGGFTTISIAQRAAVLVQRFATVRLALMCHVGINGTPPDEAEVLRIIQSLSRFMDHLGDADLTRMLHRDMGWESEARLLGLIQL